MSVLEQALAAGATIVTPNDRLARDVARRFDAARRAAGERAWDAPLALPWTLWVERLWRAALAARLHASPPSLLDKVAAREAWFSIVARQRRDLLNPRGAARRAADAWTTFHAWRDPFESIGRVAAGGSEDPAVFAQWAERYRTRLAALDAIDAARLPDALTELANASWVGGGGAAVVLHGFLALTPQQRRLVQALRNAGVPIDEAPAPADPASRARRAAFGTPREEIARALGFARTRLGANPRARIAIVVADLDRRRDEVIALADEILCPEQLLALPPDSARPYGVSLGEPLSRLPIVACALDLIALAAGRVDAARAASALRSPFLPDAHARWALRAGVEDVWLALGQRQVGWPEVLSALRAGDPDLHRRLAAIAPPPRAARLPREWAHAWSAWLAALGWPGGATLTSAQWQAREAWSAAVAKFAATGMVTGALPAASALDQLRAMLAEALFQPEAEPAPIQILGVLEAAGLAFDCAWLAGFDAQRWPAPVAPNPFLPLAWQHARGVPRAHPDTALAQARQLTSALRALAPDIVVSHVRTIDDAPASVSPLFGDCEAVDAAELPGSGRFALAMPAGAMERVADADAPPIAAGTPVRGGAALFDAQSACPFQAFARYRLGARAWSERPEGLSAPERGKVLHGMLAAFWDAVGDQASLGALDAPALSARIAAAVEAGKAKLEPGRWRALAPAVARAEAGRLESTLRAWIDEAERPRPPFRVRSHETRLASEVEGLALSVRVDRVDELAQGGLAIVDYKSGRVVPPSRWLGERPEGVQLAVYANAVEATTHDPIRALAYAQVRAGEIAVAGVAEASGLWPALDARGDPLRARLGGWDEVRARLHAGVAGLARDIRDGRAAVAPRNRETCRLCGLDALCRIQGLDDVAADAPPGGASDE